MKMIAPAVLGLAALLLLGSAPLLAAKKEFPPWSEGVYAEVKRIIDEKQGGNRGAMASARLRSMWQFISVHLHDPIEMKLEAVNDELNGLTWIADSDLWKKDDYWATPFETITTFGGDCEDIAIAKYAVLRLMAVPDEHLGFAHVVTKQGEHHMVLVYKSPDLDRALILDNQNPDVKPADERPDLIGVYIFQNDGTIYIIKDEGNAQRTIKSRQENKQLKKWLTVKERARANIESFIPFNDGKPLIPEWALTDK